MTQGYAELLRRIERLETATERIEGNVTAHGKTIERLQESAEFWRMLRTSVARAAVFSAAIAGVASVILQVIAR